MDRISISRGGWHHVDRRDCLASEDVKMWLSTCMPLRARVRIWGQIWHELRACSAGTWRSQCTAVF